jgi:hypothetical protein
MIGLLLPSICELFRRRLKLGLDGLDGSPFTTREPSFVVLHSAQNQNYPSHAVEELEPVNILTKGQGYSICHRMAQLYGIHFHIFPLIVERGKDFTCMKVHVQARPIGFCHPPTAFVG